MVSRAMSGFDCVEQGNLYKDHKISIHYPDYLTSTYVNQKTNVLACALALLPNKRTLTARKKSTVDLHQRFNFEQGVLPPPSEGDWEWARGSIAGR